MKNELNIVGNYVQPILVSVDLIRIDDGTSRLDYQRGERQSFVEWDWGKYDPVRLGIRTESEYHVIEGGHRVRQARKFSITKLPAFIHKSTGALCEADLFVSLALCRKGLKARERYKAAVAAGHPRESALHDVLIKHGLLISNNDEWPNIKSVSCMLRMPIEAVDFSLGIICETWNGDGDALREPIIVGGDKGDILLFLLESGSTTRMKTRFQPQSLCRGMLP